MLTVALVRRWPAQSLPAMPDPHAGAGRRGLDSAHSRLSRLSRHDSRPRCSSTTRWWSGSMSTHCWHGPGHLPLAAYRLDKHWQIYDAHLLDALMHQDVETAALLRRNDELERAITSDLCWPWPRAGRNWPRCAPDWQLADAAAAVVPDTVPPVAAHGGGQAGADVAALESALQAASAESRALRTSMSWRITRPLRAVYGWWLHRLVARSAPPRLPQSSSVTTSAGRCIRRARQHRASDPGGGRDPDRGRRLDGLLHLPAAGASVRRRHPRGHRARPRRLRGAQPRRLADRRRLHRLARRRRHARTGLLRLAAARSDDDRILRSSPARCRRSAVPTTCGPPVR